MWAVLDVAGDLKDLVRALPSFQPGQLGIYVL